MAEVLRFEESEAVYQEALANELKNLVCSGDKSAPYILRGLTSALPGYEKLSRIVAPGPRPEHEWLRIEQRDRVERRVRIERQFRLDDMIPKGHVLRRISEREP